MKENNNGEEPLLSSIQKKCKGFLFGNNHGENTDYQFAAKSGRHSVGDFQVTATRPPKKRWS
eukprot:CCRYP_015581-RA/>CCRYP_015581-RA protein AED:0.47 eAED:0.47 QI:47/1/1/1/0/0/2/122/61